MRFGNFKFWRSQILCWSLFALFLAVAMRSSVIGSQEPSKSHSASDLHAYLLVGAVSGFIAVVFFILALRAKIQKGNNDVA